MRRLGIVLLVAAAVVVALVATGILDVEVRLRPPGELQAQPFWRDARGAASVPEALRIWTEIARSVTPAVVHISTTQRIKSPLGEEFFRQFFGGPVPQSRTALGTGFVASPDGYVVTNHHVIADASEVVVRLADQRERRARIVGTDPLTDLALLKIDAEGMPVIPFGDSDRIEVGAPVMAIGNPYGLDQTVTTGIVSAKERFIGAGPYDSFIQTDASINPGNSGGPLVDTSGALVGINSAIFSQTGAWSGIGFAIPVNLAKSVLGQIRATGRVVRGYLGVVAAPVSPDVAAERKLDGPRGALVAEVVGRSPAASAGLQPGDVITAFEEQRVGSPRDLTRVVASTAPGTRVDVEVVRGRGERRTIAVTLGELTARERR